MGIREGARTSFPDWGNTVDSKMAKIVLFDQLSRNCFRGTDEAYAYDYLAQPLARNLADYALNNNDNDQKDSTTATSGEMYGIYGNFCILTLMHSETPEDHELALDLIEWGESVSPNMPWDFIKGFELEHKAVIDRLAGIHTEICKRIGKVQKRKLNGFLKRTNCLDGQSRMSDHVKHIVILKSN